MNRQDRSSRSVTFEPASMKSENDNKAVSYHKGGNNHNPDS